MSGIFILSLDTEIAWGTSQNAHLSVYKDTFTNYRQYVRRLIDLLDQYHISATWGVVGALFYENYQAMMALEDSQYQSFPISEHPLDQVEYESWFFAPDIIDMIRSAKTKQEIGTHTFTHIYTADPAVNPVIWDAQLKNCVTVFNQCGLSLRSIIYPKNMIDYTDTLPKYGIIAYRGLEERWYYKGVTRFHQGARFLDSFLAWSPPTYDPSSLLVNDSLVNLPASQFLQHFGGIKKYIPLASRVLQARRGIQNAIKHDHIFHLWFHPFNLGAGARMFDALEQIFIEVNRQQALNQLQVMTMDEMATKIIEEYKEQ